MSEQRLTARGDGGTDALMLKAAAPYWCVQQRAEALCLLCVRERSRGATMQSVLHTYPCAQEVHLRRAADADGGVRVLAPVQLSSFLEASLTAQLALSRNPRLQQRVVSGAQQLATSSAAAGDAHTAALERLQQLSLDGSDGSC